MARPSIGELGSGWAMLGPPFHDHRGQAREEGSSPPLRARKLKQQGPGAFLPVDRTSRDEHVAVDEDDDEFSGFAAKYGAFDDDDEDDDG